ncbi:beta-N-acetylglucosaminidase domain-containing protein [Novosphingobium sp. PhB165]|uniref:beta-N-acetylhexosaminidase family protein n=1 Tax=Novosphingobium sp. PhB165 TaxID=2485105 RepID=UPI00104B9D40|nr:beta-N-acetylglucosaminidase domain-containing protein [Novosphingobium sp. PhB165]
MTETLPGIFPTPTSMQLNGGTVTLGTSVVLVQAAKTDAETVELVRQILSNAGVTRIRTATHIPAKLDQSYIVIGAGNSAILRSAVGRVKAALPTEKEGYTLASTVEDGGNLTVLAGFDGDGLFHAAQTLRQLAKRASFPAVRIHDFPSMPVRGTIEGFYGAPWTMQDRSAHLAFLGRAKANTYIYSPKDDPFARDKWRDDYPAATLKQLGELVHQAERNHIDFVYAISPGPSVCYSSPADLQALRRKFDAIRGLSVRTFYVALDDIEYTKWNCDADKEKFGPASDKAAAAAQAYLLNAVQADLASGNAAGPSLIMVPTEYYNATESPYKAGLREKLDPRIIVQWTGTDVVPPAISIPDAKAATKAFGRKTLLWDNYPVNDYAQSTGRLLVAPYARREAGLSSELTGIVANPMNQEAPSRVAVMGLTAFAWNDKAYDAELTWHAAARELASDDPRTTAALLTFFDTQHLAPTFGTQPWQPQAPRLKAVLDHVREALAQGDAAARKAALKDLARQADDIANAPDIIRAGVADKGFVAQSAPWLDAMQRWGRALQLTAAGLSAADEGSGTAQPFFADAKRMADEAAAIRSIPGATRFEGPIKIADGVLDLFIADAPGLIATP